MAGSESGILTTPKTTQLGPMRGRGDLWRAYYGIENLACSLLCITQDHLGYLWIGPGGRGESCATTVRCGRPSRPKTAYADDTVNCILEDWGRHPHHPLVGRKLVRGVGALVDDRLAVVD